MTREECIDILYGKVSAELPITRRQYDATLEGWDIQSVEIDGQSAGVTMLRDREIHVVIDQVKAMLHGRRIIRKCLSDNVEKYGYLITRTFKGDKVASFLERLGFYKTGEDDTFSWYRIDQAKIH